MDGACVASQGQERDLTPTVHVTDAGRRIHVRLTVPDPTKRPHPTVLRREAFPRHGDAVWLPARSCWSLPGALSYTGMRVGVTVGVSRGRGRGNRERIAARGWCITVRELT